MANPFELIDAKHIQQYFQLPNNISISQQVFDLRHELIQIYRNIHRSPEISWQEINTTKYISNYLNNISSICGKENLTIKTGTHYGTKSEFIPVGVVATLKGANNGECIMLRADIDALPIQENTNLSFASQINGISHCCGHDAHIAILLITAKILCAYQSYICGNIKFVFQPAEEHGPGSYWMIKDGILCNPKVDRVFALHLSSTTNIGEILLNNSTVLAGSNIFRITIFGKGGHGGLPHLTQCVIVAQSTLIQSIQTIISRNIAAHKGGVISIGSIHSNQGGFNILPDSIVMEGTMRWYHDDTKNILQKRLIEICNGIEEMYQVKIKYENLNEYNLDYEATINKDIQCFNVVCDESRKVVGRNNVNDKCEPIAASEDFSYFLNSVGKGTYFFLGAKDINDNNPPNHHTQTFKINEKCLLIGAQVMINIVGSLLCKTDMKKHVASKL